MQAGNAFYKTPRDIPRTLPILSLPSVVLLPGGFVPVSIEDSHYIRMIDDAMRGNRLVGVIQPWEDGEEGCTGANDNHTLYNIGCIGRITNYSEVGDGKIFISLQGVCRFRLDRELTAGEPYRRFVIRPYFEDLQTDNHSDKIDRDTFLAVFQDYMEMNDMQADWDTILEASDETLVNALSIMVPFGTAEKQALLEAPDLKTRSETLIAIAERSIIGQNKGHSHYLQ